MPTLKAGSDGTGTRVEVSDEHTARVAAKVRAFPAAVQSGALVDEASRTVLAARLSHELLLFAKHGERLLGWESLVPILKLYAETCQERNAVALADALAELAWKAAGGAMSAEECFEAAQAVRGETTWALDTGERADVASVDRALRSNTRGPKPPDLQKRRAARVYRVIAWGSRAAVAPVLLDSCGRELAARRDAEALSELFDLQEWKNSR